MPQYIHRERIRIAVFGEGTKWEDCAAILRNNGYAASTHRSEEFARTIAEGHYDIAVLSLRPSVDARNIVSFSYRNTPDLSIIITSGHPSVLEAVEFLDLGAFDYLSEPFAIEQLLSVIRRAPASRRYNASADRDTIDNQRDELDPSKPLVLLLGDVDHEGVSSSLRTAGRQFKKKMLISRPSNWESIIEYFEQFTISAVVAKFSPRIYELLLEKSYAEVADRLLTEISNVPHVVFVFEGLLSGDFSQEYADDFYQPPTMIRETINSIFDAKSINVLSYRRNAEVTILAQNFLSDNEYGLLFRVYVPSGRLWANETDRLLQLFRDYLAKVGHAAVRLDQIRTDCGVIYEFHGADTIKEGALSKEFEDFSHLLDLSVSNPDQAEALLRAKHVDVRDISDILARYGKEAKRLQVDLRHERERKLLGIRHRLESELIDVLPSSMSVSDLEQLAETAVPLTLGVASAIGSGQGPALLSGVTAHAVTINMNSQIIDAVNAVVADEIQGAVHLTHEDRQILGLIQQHGAERMGELASAVHELSDPTAPQSGRLLAKQKLKAFLYRVGSKATDVGTGILQSYIEKKLLGL